MPKFERKLDNSWDFLGENTKTYTHGIHSYPAMFIPQVARRLIETYSKKGDTVCDIFCGAGTALVESRVLSRNAVGIDLNPLAVFLSKVKTTPIVSGILTKSYIQIVSLYHSIKKENICKPQFKNIDFWFKESVIVDLARLKRAIQETVDKEARKFFMVIFSDVVRLSSNSKNGEFKLVRISPDKLSDFNPNIIELFKKRAEPCIANMQKYFDACAKAGDVEIDVRLGDSSTDLGIKDNSIDCIITSPPYGDSRTTVAYGQFSRLSSQWLDLYSDSDKASGLDGELLGGKVDKTLLNTLCSDYLEEVLQKITQKDHKRASEVLSFFLGLNKCIGHAYKMLKQQKYFCVVVGNRLVKQVRIPTDYIIAELATNYGFSVEDIVVRNIPGKRMPSKNSPTNVAGVLEETMLKESIVILKKTR